MKQPLVTLPPSPLVGPLVSSQALNKEKTNTAVAYKAGAVPAEEKPLSFTQKLKWRAILRIRDREGNGNDS
jgi:hypothetical protein